MLWRNSFDSNFRKTIFLRHVLYKLFLVQNDIHKLVQMRFCISWFQEGAGFCVSWFRCSVTYAGSDTQVKTWILHWAWVAPLGFSYSIINFGICISNSSKISLTLSLRGDVEINRVS